MWGSVHRAHQAEHAWCCLCQCLWSCPPTILPIHLDPPADLSPAPFSDPLQGSVMPQVSRGPCLLGMIGTQSPWESAGNPRVRIPHRGTTYIAQPAASSTVGHTGEAWDLIKNAETDSGVLEGVVWARATFFNKLPGEALRLH